MKAFGLLSLLSASLVWGCATPRELGESTGNLTDAQLAPDLFQVEFRGTPYESVQKARDLVLLRAAELVQKHGFAAFEVVNEGASLSPYEAKSPGTALTSGSIQPDASGAYFSGHTTYAPGRIYDWHGSSIQVLVRGLQDKHGNAAILDPIKVQRGIREKYGLR